MIQHDNLHNSLLMIGSAPAQPYTGENQYRSGYDAHGLGWQHRSYNQSGAKRNSGGTTFTVFHDITLYILRSKRKCVTAGLHYRKRFDTIITVIG